MEEVYTSAPGKLILFGEHAVMYDVPAIVTSIDKRINVAIRRSREGYIRVSAPDIKLREYIINIHQLNQPIEKIPRKARYVVAAVRNFYSKYGIEEGLEIKTQGKIGKEMVSAGSSSAVTVATILGLTELYNIKLSKQDLFELGYKAHTLDVQKGSGSGFDIAAAVYGGTLKFKFGGSLIQPIETTELPLLYAGIPRERRTTPDVVRWLRKKIEKYPQRYKTTWLHIQDIVEEAVNMLQSQNWKKLGELMNANHAELVRLGVSSRRADRIRYAAIEAGAYGAKMTGSYGDNIIALVPEENKEKVINAMKKEGGKVIEIKTNVEGAKVT
jgi:mevalonate kinase